ncbi:MAG: C39 family peptidase [Oscillospiraceae bacterium]|nr:C39 family peptidase [Oscillospiraceae bacterium]
MAHYSGILMAAFAAVMALGCGSMQVSAASAEEILTETEAAIENRHVTEGGWVVEGGKQYYIYADGTKAVGETEIAGVSYLFGFSGALKTDWQTVNGKRYYYDPASGEPVFGWVSYFDQMYYVSPEDGKVTGLYDVDGVHYAFAEDGVQLKGEFYVEDVRYYADPENGVLKEGFFTLETGEVILTDINGAVVTGGWYDMADGRRYYIDPETSQAVYGLAGIDGAVYYLTPENGIIRGAAEVGGVVYPFDEVTGARTAGWFSYEGRQYYFDAETQSGIYGSLADIDDNTYYFDENGAMATGWITVEGVQYYFQTDGTKAMSISLEINGIVYDFDENGLSDVQAEDTPEIPDEIIEEVPGVLHVIDYKQKDERWSSVKLGTSASSTIGKVGCLVTSMAMVHSYTTNETYTPVDMKDMLKFTSGGGLANWSYISDLGYTVETYSTSVTITVLQHVYEQLMLGKPVVLGSKKGSGQHYVAITGYTGDGTSFTTSDFLINDPGYSRRFRLSDHLAQYGTLYKLIY